MKQPKRYTQYRRMVIRLIGPYEQPEVAKSAELSIDNIQDWVAGRTRPSKPALRKLIDHYVAWREHFGLPSKPLVDEALALLLDTPDAPKPEKEE